MSIFRTIALFVYLFGYMIVHYSVLCKAERALAAGDTETVRQLVKKHIPHWSKGILNVTGVRLSVEGLDNIPKDGPCVFVANHRSYYDIPLLLAGSMSLWHPRQGRAGKNSSAQPLDEAAGLRFRPARRCPRLGARVERRHRHRGERQELHHLP